MFPIFGKSKNLKFQSLEKPKFRIVMFRKGKIWDSDVWKSQNLEYQCLEKVEIYDSKI